MGIWDTITDLVEAATPWSVVEAEAPAQEEQVRALFLSSRLPAFEHPGTGFNSAGESFCLFSI